MSERKWTPGPWAWRYEDGGHMEADQWFLSPGVLMADGTDGTPSGDSIDRANARLIAAAPEMYEVLDALAHHPAHQDTAMGRRARDILSKARGEA